MAKTFSCAMSRLTARAADAYFFCVAEWGGADVKLVARSDSRTAPSREARVSLCPRVDEAHIFDAETGARLERDRGDVDGGRS